jgi:flagellar assembly protein FliH
MASPVIPKEQLTAYQRWELLGFEDGPGQAGPRRGGREEPEEVPLPTAEQIEQIHQQAAQEGFKIGKDEGYKAGYEAGRKEAKTLAAKGAELADQLDHARLRQDDAIAQELLGLALTVAKQLLRTALEVKEGLVVEAIREAMSALPSLTGHLRVSVHPSDVDALREFMESEHGQFSFKIAPDIRLKRGSFRLETNHSEVDGQLPTRWREIVECLGGDNEWLD